MHAYLLIGRGGLDVNIKKIIGKENQTIYFNLQKIDDVRELQALLKFKGGEKRYFVLKDFQNASVEAMNAFLKMLEEPGKNIYFILCANTEKNILETITSRCNVIRLGHQPNTKSLKYTKNFLDKKMSSKLNTLHKISGREDALDFLNNLIEGGHAMIKKNYKKYNNLTGIISSAIETKKEVEMNANITIAFTKLSLDLVSLCESNYN